MGAIISYQAAEQQAPRRIRVRGYADQDRAAGWPIPRVGSEQETRHERLQCYRGAAGEQGTAAPLFRGRRCVPLLPPGGLFRLSTLPCFS